MTIGLWLLAAYLLGAIPASYLAGRAAGADLRLEGSKNVGATNLYRVAGLRFAIPAGLFDLVKGFAPTFFAPSSPPWLPVAVGGAAVLGHVFPVYLGFRGGKGVATAAGVVLALAPVALAVSAVVWAGTVALTKFVSLASLLGAVSFPVAVRIVQPDDAWTLAIGVVLTLFIVYTHRSNIQRLLAGRERRVGRRPRADTHGSG